MTNNGRDLKRVYIPMLQPYFEVLEHLETKMNHDQWINYVERTVEYICNDPEQYLGNNIPSKEVVAEIIREVFEEFLSSHVSMV
ncbi:hypothetical protein [Ohtaekwangia koreensis]|uniref:Uncharacterized protein n=1 Tax=Ohtaekwangia koreensis TaxID=688867 RepID=A0A1T5M4X3_9BACT|nr:hypothetical protein [Ohtaekwangia koreensis]SKC83297.1 hypothetical protein SAMN05660236_4412 [Ohtaekwangia koreensis]